MTKTFNQDPYYDDFNVDKNFYKILFKPGVSVQARELTQLQSIQQNQIRQFGDHVFKHGSVVIPGNSFADLEMHYVKLQSTPTTPADLSTLLEKDIVGATNGVIATIRKVVPATGTDPLTIYVGYKSGGAGGAFSVFADGEELTVSGLNNVTLQAQDTEAVGFGSLAYINKGTFYVSGIFVNVDKQSIVISKYSSVPSCRVLLKIVETVVDSEEDESLLDPAQGTYNYAAPGADRHKIELVLTALPLTESVLDDYIEIMRYNAGVLEEHSRYPKYNELEKSLARRTYDESGDYVVDGLAVTAREHLRSDPNGGLYPEVPESPEIPAGDAAKFIIETAPGKAYVRGFENEVISTRRLVLDKGRTADHIKTRNLVSINPDYAQFIYVADVKGFPAIKPYGTVSLKLSDGTVLGTCKCIGVDLASEDIYKFYINDIEFNAGRSLDEVAKISYNGGSAKFLHKLNFRQTGGVDFVKGDIITDLNSTKSATFHKYTRAAEVAFVFLHTTDKLPALSANCALNSSKFGTVNGVTSTESSKTNSTIFPLGFSSAAGVLDVEYKVNVRQVVALVNGGGSFTVSGMSVDSFENGSFFVSSETLGVLDVSGKVDAQPTTVTFTAVRDSTNALVTGNAVVVFTATKIGANAQPKTKTLKTVTVTTSLANDWALGHADIYDVLEISSAGSNVIGKFTLDTGADDYGYFRGRLILNAGETQTANISVQYRYFEHSASGDFFSADSYLDSGVPYEAIPKFKSNVDSTFYDLKNCIDFRSYINDTSPAGLPVINQYVDFPPNGSRITASVRFYVPRIDLIVINKSGSVQAVTGTPAELPVSQDQPVETLLLAKVFVPEYTNSIVDVIVENINNKRYTMRDINEIDNKVYRLNQYSLLLAKNLNNLDNRVVNAVNTINRRIDDTEVRATALEEQNATQDAFLTNQALQIAAIEKVNADQDAAIKLLAKQNADQYAQLALLAKQNADQDAVIKAQELALAQLAYDTAVGQAAQDAALLALQQATAANTAAIAAQQVATQTNTNAIAAQQVATQNNTAAINNVNDKLIALTAAEAANNAALAEKLTAEQNAARALLEYNTNAKINAEVDQLGFMISAVSKDVKNLDARVTREGGAIRDRFARIEQFITSDAAGQASTNVGYLIDKFEDPESVADITNPQFSASYYVGCLVPAIESNEVHLALTTFESPPPGNYRISSPNGHKVMHLPFTEVVFAEQRLSSRVTNVNAFAVYSWNGKMALFPSSDTWTEVEYAPAVLKGRTEVVNTTTSVRRAWNWQPDDGTLNVNNQAPNFAQAPLPAPLPACFVGETVVDMADSTTKRISDIQVGDVVMSWDNSQTNVVRFVEIVESKEHLLYSPDVQHEPFATINHPLYIDGKLSVIGESNYSWLGEMAQLLPARATGSRQTVYNIWVTGDGTYRVNGYGTTSIMGDGGWISDRFADGSLSDARIIEIIEDCSDNPDKQLGAVLINNLLQKMDNSLINRLVVGALKTRGGVLELAAFAIFKQVGAFARRSFK